jgi:hypothetical protein
MHGKDVKLYFVWGNLEGCMGDLDINGRII